MNNNNDYNEDDIIWNMITITIAYNHDDCNNNTNGKRSRQIDK